MTGKKGISEDERLYSVNKKMQKYSLITPFLKLYVNPEPAAAFFGMEVIWNSSSAKPLVTIDDSPSPDSTFRILDILDEYNIKAVFFISGANGEKYPQIIDEITKRGHLKGNHGYRHTRADKMTFDEFSKDFSLADQIIYGSENYFMKLYRPPYGRGTRKIFSFTLKSGYRNLMWSLLTLDYLSTFELSKFAIKNFLKSDSIVVFHDNKESIHRTTGLIKFLIETTKDKHFECGTPSECLK